MSNIATRIGENKQTPEEAAAVDASIRASRRSVGVRQMIAEIKAAQEAGKEPHVIQLELGHWEEEYPRLFEMLTGPGYSEAMLNAILTQLEAVEAGARTAHDASVAVGTALVNSYVRPQLGMAPAPLPNSSTQPARRGGRRTGGSR